MPYDTNGVLSATVTKTTSFTAAGVDLGTGTPRRGLKAQFIVPSYVSATTPGSVFTPTIYGSSDNTTFIALATGTPLTGGTAAVTTQEPIYVPFDTSFRYVAAGMPISGSTGSPSITWSARLGIARP